jgi:protein-S-isoprenylcysteine O-methyltransferase Ste14
LILLGAGLSLWAIAEADEMDISSPQKLVKEGPYALSRNPMYVGWTLVHAGLSFLLDAFWLIVLVPPVVAYTHLIDIRREEESLGREFGDEYLAYKRRVRRYL